MKYRCLNKNYYELDSYSIVPYRVKDSLDILHWRNEQIDVLRQKKPLTKQDQANYYQKVIKPSFTNPNPSIVLFSFLKESRCIGYGGLTNIDWKSKRAELSFLLSTKRAEDEIAYSQDFSTYLKLIKRVIFKDLKFHRLFTETFDIRPLHIQILEKSGFAYEGKMHDHVLINGKYIDSIIHGWVN